MNREEFMQKIPCAIFGLLSPEEMCEMSEMMASDPELAGEYARVRKIFREVQMAGEPPLGARKLDAIGKDVAGILSEGVAKRKRRERGYDRAFGFMLRVAAVLVLLSAGAYYFVNTFEPSYSVIMADIPTTIVSGAPLAVRTQVVDGKSNRPAGGVRVAARLTRRDDWAQVWETSLTTDAEGVIGGLEDLPELAEGDYELTLGAGRGWSATEVRQQVRVVKKAKIHLTTDKPAYQPGEIINIRAVGLNPMSRKPLAAAKVLIEIHDPQGNKIAKHEKIASEFGIAWLRFPLADEPAYGEYRIGVTLENEIAEKVVTVKRYQLPKFRLEAVPDKGYYKHGEEIALTCTLQYYFGKPVQNATVVLGGDYPEGGQTIAEATTDAEGRARFTFDATPHGDGPLYLNVAARDAAGQTVEKTVTVNVVEHDFSLALIPEGGKIVRGIENRVYVIAGYPDGRPAEVEFEIFGERHRTDAQGAATLVLPTLTEERTVTIRARDASGRAATFSQKISVYAPETRMVIRTDSPVYTAGDSLRAAVLSTLGDDAVFFDLVSNGQVVLTKRVLLRNGKAEFAMAIPTGIAGVLSIRAGMLGHENRLVSATTNVFVRPASELAVKVDGADKIMRPGDDVRLAFTVTDKDGKPVRAALGVYVVDEAALAMGGIEPGVMRRFFLLAREMLTDPKIYRLPLAQESLLENDGAEFDRPGYRAMLTTPVRDTERAERFREPVRRFIGNDSRPSRAWRRWTGNVRGGILWTWGTFFGALMLLGIARNIDLPKPRMTKTRRLVGWFALIAFIAFVGGIIAGMCFPAFHRMPPSSDGILDRLRARSVNIIGGFDKAESEKLLEAKIDVRSEIMTDDDHGESAGAAEPVIRRYFPETLLFVPELVTDENGRATECFRLADSITNWKVALSAVSKDGELGETAVDIVAYQPFFVDVDAPPVLTRGDETTVRAVVHNHSKEALEVLLEPEALDGLVLIDGSSRRVSLAIGEVRSLDLKVRAERPGEASLKVAARAGEIGDAMIKRVYVRPAGRRVPFAVNAMVAGDGEIKFDIPSGIEPDSIFAQLKVYPQPVNAALEGIEGLLRIPHGCFEQTSSIVYPNVMAVRYLRTAATVRPELEARAVGLLATGYQRLLTFEVNGSGGFSLYGEAPASLWLSAYALMEFSDMQKVMHVDERLIGRNRDYVLANIAHENLDVSHGLYAAWALAESGEKQSAATIIDRLLDQRAVRDNTYTRALAAAALAAIRPDDVRICELLNTKSSDREDVRTISGGYGASGNVETVALEALALIRAGGDGGEIQSRIERLLGMKNSDGYFGSTQGTVLTIKAVCEYIEGHSVVRMDEALTVAVNGKKAGALAIGPETSDVVHALDLTDALSEGANAVALSLAGKSRLHVSLAGWYHVPGAAAAEKGPIDIRAGYSRTRLKVGDRVDAKITVDNLSDGDIENVMVDIGLVPGMTVDADSIDRIRRLKNVARVETTATQIVIYMRKLPRGRSQTIEYAMYAERAGNVSSGNHKAYEYYAETKGAVTSGTTFVIDG